MSERTRWVVVGYGMGAYHARLIAGVEELELYGVCDLDAEKRQKAGAEHPGIHLYSRFEDVLADKQVDGAVIVTPHNVHAPMAIASMEAGKHTITDKAMCLTVAEARQMIAARDRAGVLLSVFHNRRWDRDFLTVRKVVESGMLGRLYHLESHVASFALVGGWRAQREQMGGWLFDWGAHTIDQILLLEPSRPRSVYAFAHHRFEDPQTVEDLVSCTITFVSGFTATTVISYLSRLPSPRWHVLGERAALSGEDFEKPLRVRGNLEGIDGELSVPLVKGDWQSFYQNIADALAGRAELEVRPEQLVPQIAIAEAAYRSITAGQAEPVIY